LLPGHAFLLLRSGEDGISRLMHRLLTGHARYFNRRHRRRGALFQKRFKSFVCQEETYFKVLIRYIHLKPVWEKTVKNINDLNKYPYTGHSALLGNCLRDWQDRRFVLSGFGKDRKRSRMNYMAYISAGWAHQKNIKSADDGWEEIQSRYKHKNHHQKRHERILGDSHFVESILSKTNGKFASNGHHETNGADFRKIEQQVVEAFGIQRDLIYVKGRRRIQVRARSLLCYLAVRDLGLSRSDLARRLEMTQPAIGYAVDRGKQIAAKFEII
jgi:hypothetical protein